MRPSCLLHLRDWVPFPFVELPFKEDKRGKAKQGRLPGGSPYGCRDDDDGNPHIYEPEARFVRRIFPQYADEGTTAPAIVFGLDRS